MRASTTAELRPLLAWASDHIIFPLPGTHPFPLAKYALVRERLLAVSQRSIAPSAAPS